MSSVSNGLYFLTLPLVSLMHVIYRKIRHANYLYIKRNVEKVWGARYTLGARYLSKKYGISNGNHFGSHSHVQLSVTPMLCTSRIFFHMGSECIQLQDIHRKFTHGQVCHRFHIWWGTIIHVFTYFQKKSNEMQRRSK